MLSLPLLPPQDDNSAWLRTTYRPRADSPPPANVANPHQAHRERQRRDEEKKQHLARSPLALLTLDEYAIEQRKAAVRSFGAQWIRPPGISKTLQAMNEEQLEREEQAEIERQEAGMRDMQAQQQLAEAQQQAEETAAAATAAAEQGAEDEERNLDDEIPEADVTFNEDSMMEGSSQRESTELDGEQFAEIEEAELTGAARDEEELGIEPELERDLDDSVPEAGSYQHTDTEVEDSDSDSELQSSLIAQSAPRATHTPSLTRLEPPLLMPGLQERMRAQVSAADYLARSPGNFDLSSSVLDTSAVMGSSPVAQRTNANGRGRGGNRARRPRYS